MNISKQKGNSLKEKQFWELNLNTNSQENSRADMDVEQTICTKAVRNKFNKQKFNSVKKEMTCRHAQWNWAKIMDRDDVSIEKVAEQFLVEGSEIEKRDGPYTDDHYINAQKNILNDFMHIF